MQAGQRLPHTRTPMPHTRIPHHFPQSGKSHHRDRLERLFASRQRNSRPLRHHTHQNRAVDLARSVRAQRKHCGQRGIREDTLSTLRTKS